MKFIVKMPILLFSVSIFLFSICVSKTFASDSDVQRNVEMAIEGATDLPREIRVEVSNGIVRVTGSLQCESCGGNATPGQLSTIQQSLGAVIRAVPGVTHVEFYFSRNE